MLSVGVAVDPKNPNNFNKELKIILDYKVTMTDVIIMVSDHDEEMGTSPRTNGEDELLNYGRSSESGSAFELEMRKEFTESDNEINDLNRTSQNSNISGSRSSRPLCHRSRTESQKSQLQLLESRSNIPLLNGASLSLKPCSYYRQKFNNEDPTYWINATALQKSAGQKVVRKINDQHRSLAEAAQQRKRSIGSYGYGSRFSDANDIHLDSHERNFVILKKKPTRLEPLQISQKLII